MNHSTGDIVAPSSCRRKLEILEGLYPIPQPLDSYEDWERYHHLDLDDLSLAQLRLELDRARFRLMLDDSPSEWHLERVRVLEQRVHHAG